MLVRGQDFPGFGDGEGVALKFRPEARIRCDPEFRRILRKGIKHQSRHFTLHILYGQIGQSRLGIIATKKTGNAVSRNRAKRLLRETFRQHYLKLPSGTEIVAVTKRQMYGATLKEVEKAFLSAVDLQDV